MKTAFIIGTVGIALVLSYFTILGLRSKSSRSPRMVSGRLARCPETSNCVCSEFPGDTIHYIEPIEYFDTAPEKAWAEIRRIIGDQGGKIMHADEAYLSATFSVSWFGFIDDVECRLVPSESKIHIRSASRVGHHDLGVNRKRVETIIRLFRLRLQTGFGAKRIKP